MPQPMTGINRGNRFSVGQRFGRLAMVDAAAVNHRIAEGVSFKCMAVDSLGGSHPDEGVAIAAIADGFGIRIGDEQPHIRPHQIGQIFDRLVVVPGYQQYAAPISGQRTG